MPKTDSSKAKKSSSSSSSSSSPSSSSKKSPKRRKEVDNEDDSDVAAIAASKMKKTAERLISLLVAQLPYETVGERTKLSLFEAIVKNLDHTEIKQCIESDLQHFFLFFEEELEKLKLPTTNSSASNSKLVEDKALVFTDLHLQPRAIKYLGDPELEKFLLKASVGVDLSAESILALVATNLRICVEIAPVLILNFRNLVLSSSNSTSGNISNSNSSSKNSSKNSGNSSNNNINKANTCSRGVCQILLDRLCLNSTNSMDSPVEIACILAFSLFTSGVPTEKLHATTCLMASLNADVVAYLIGLIGYFGNKLSEIQPTVALSPAQKLAFEQYLNLLYDIVTRPSQVSTATSCSAFSQDMKAVMVSSSVLCANWVNKITENSGISSSISSNLANMLKHIVGNSSNSRLLYSSFFGENTVSIAYQASYKSVFEFLNHVATTNEGCVQLIMERFHSELSIDDLLQSFEEQQAEEDDNSDDGDDEEQEEDEEEKRVGDDNDENDGDITFEVDSKIRKNNGSSKSISVLESYLDCKKDSADTASVEDSLSMQVDAALSAESAQSATSKRSSKKSSSAKEDSSSKEDKKRRLETAPLQDQEKDQGGKRKKK